MLYTRRIEQSLPNDAHFTVSRTFAIRFREEVGGYRVEGEQVAVEVDAPESLAAFAEMERERHEQALFPLLLSHDGLIEGGDPPDGAAPDRAVQEVLHRIAELPLPADDQAELGRFARAVHANAAALLTQLPRDLFAPAEEESRHRQTLALPGGDEGNVTVAFAAETEPATGLMRSARREVVTEFGGNRRRTLESWTLVPTR